MFAEQRLQAVAGDDSPAHGRPRCRQLHGLLDEEGERAHDRLCAVPDVSEHGFVRCTEPVVLDEEIGDHFVR